MTLEPTVFIIDDDEAMRDSLRHLFESEQLNVETYASASAFIGQFDANRSGCLVADVRMPGTTGVELLELLRARSVPIPVILISAYADVDTAVRALKSGAVDYIRKPYDAKVLLERTRECIERDSRLRAKAAARADLEARLAQLTPRERETLAGLGAGKSVKQIASDLGLSRKTVDVHRSHLLLKMQVGSLVELVQALQLLEDESDAV